MSRAARQSTLFRGGGPPDLRTLTRASQCSADVLRPFAFALFILVNASLFIRPAEFVPAIEGWPIYAVLATLALLAALPQVLAQLTRSTLVERPITACVVTIFCATILSHLTFPSIWHARTAGTEFFKLLLYHLLLVAVIDSAERLRRFLACLVLLGVVVTTLALLQYHGYLDIPALAEVQHGYTDSATGEHSTVVRLVSTGIFNDPNDLCLLLVFTMAACVYGLDAASPTLFRYCCWAAPLILFAYALTLTQSRGGFLGVLAAVVVLIWTRLGWRKGLPIASIALPVMFFLYSGRQTDLAMDDGTAQERVQLWSQGLTLFRRAPVFGIGYGQFVEEIGKVAHNSFVHTFAELGFLGGTAFLGAFALAFRTVQQTRAASTESEITRLRPYLLAIITGYAVGMLSLSRAYVVPTYLVLALAVAYSQIARAAPAATPFPRVGTRLVLRLSALSVTFLAATYAFVRLFVRWD
jgi:O-antigen ligase